MHWPHSDRFVMTRQRVLCAASCGLVRPCAALRGLSAHAAVAARLGANWRAAPARHGFPGAQNRVEQRCATRLVAPKLLAGWPVGTAGPRNLAPALYHGERDRCNTTGADRVTPRK